MRSLSTRIAVACLALACAAPPEPPPEPALVALEVLQGFAAAPPTPEAPRVIALLDATRSMSRRDAAGVAYVDAARSSARRWLLDLPAAATVDLRAVGGGRHASCATPAIGLAGPVSATDLSLQGALDRVSAAGAGSLAEALFGIAEQQRSAAATPLRVVAWSALEDGCDGSLCSAAASLASRGVRLDLVVLGPAPAPDCLDDIELPRVAFVPPAPPAPVSFCVERAGPDPAVWGCSKAGGLPVATPASAARVVVPLDPPLVVDRSFPSDTRWVLELLDFPALGPGERQWRWRPMLRAGENGATP